jgi:hypothetical protein
MVPAPQQTVPGIEAQSGAPSHCQSVEFAIGHAVVLGSHVDSEAALSGGSQQCSPAGQMMLFPASAPLKGQYTPGAVSGKTRVGAVKQVGPLPDPGPITVLLPALLPELVPGLDPVPVLVPQTNPHSQLPPTQSQGTLSLHPPRH